VTGGKKVSVELFFAAGCSKCAEVRDALRTAAESAGRVEWKEIDIAKNPDRAVDAGVVSTPAVAIDGKLRFASLPSAAELQHAIRATERSR
jgi:thioredoxin 1